MIHAHNHIHDALCLLHTRALALLVPRLNYALQLRGSVVIFTGIISYFWLKRTLSATRIFALCAVLIGIGLVGASPVLLRSGAADSGSDDESSEPQSTIVPQEVGVALIIGVGLCGK